MDPIVLPPRMFAASEEPLGERSNSYHKIKKTEMIIDALEPEELEFLRNSTFGKILAIDENPPFSGTFGQYIIVRLLKVNKKYEIWILFAGTPGRMSLWEFAIVTGLNCDKKKKKKNPLNEKLYWNELFGSLNSCTVDTVIDMLKKMIVKDRDTRIKFACLAITSSVLFPSSHTPRILPEHVEMIRDLNEFLAYPWGRASYLTLITSIISNDEIALSQIDGETPDEVAAPVEANVSRADKPLHANKYCLIPGHAKTIDTECQLPVMSLIEEPYEEWSTGADFDMVDETDDLAVDQMVGLIEEGFKFRMEMFKGGLTGNDLSRMRLVKKPKEKEPRDKFDKENVVEMTDVESSDREAIVQLFASQISDKLSSSSRDICQEISLFEIRLEKAIHARGGRSD
ncbi:uncharacterized protein LOC106453716 [Brassica napus]|uniref:uncharacterized protein LOC106453716 n=1 Tax=Brassica napus TaxID=3708 RepID=UPI0006AB7232|nr:uncharacterized protein LOC106453716 [Brassica napus]